MEFAPRKELLSFSEIETVVDALIARGVRRLRLTGGEPLVRRGISELLARLGGRVGHGLGELTLTTNGTLLEKFAQDIFAAGIRRINVSLDTRDAERYRGITRRGNLAPVLNGIAHAKAIGLAVKINMVALRGLNEDEIVPMLAWCVEQGFDLSLIETMPLGFIDEDRADRYLPLNEIEQRLARDFTLVPAERSTGGPARYLRVKDTASHVGFITPLSHNFCAGCNRIRITATGEVFGCLGGDQKVDFKQVLRGAYSKDFSALLAELMAGKPLRHNFDIAAPRPAVTRNMNVTGG